MIKLNFLFVVIYFTNSVKSAVSSFDLCRSPMTLTATAEVQYFSTRTRGKTSCTIISQQVDSKEIRINITEMNMPNELRNCSKGHRLEIRESKWDYDDFEQLLSVSCSPFAVPPISLTSEGSPLALILFGYRGPNNGASFTLTYQQIERGSCDEVENMTILSNVSTFLMSPNYPRRYPQFELRCYILEADEGFVIELRILQIFLPNEDPYCRSGDSLSLYDGYRSDDLHLKQSFCDANSTNLLYQSMNNYMKLRFRTETIPMPRRRDMPPGFKISILAIPSPRLKQESERARRAALKSLITKVIIIVIPTIMVVIIVATCIVNYLHDRFYADEDLDDKPADGPAVLPEKPSSDSLNPENLLNTETPTAPLLPSSEKLAIAQQDPPLEPPMISQVFYPPDTISPTRETRF